MTEPDSYYSHPRQALAGLIIPSRYGRVLEIGCGTGAFATHYNSGSEIWGIEPNRDAARQAKLLMDKVLIGTYREVENDLPSNYFDLVVCNDVIEHMPDGLSFLDDIQKTMSPGARLAGSIPNVRYYRNLGALLLQKDWKYRDEGILDQTHALFFTKKSIARALEEANYRIELLVGINEGRDATQAPPLQRL